MRRPACNYGATNLEKKRLDTATVSGRLVAHQ
jgi:hypothetical protein